MVKDHGRAEDVTQEVFVSALRRMRETEQPLAFKPWLYQIAKNSCIDAFRRSKRAEEVSYDADDALAPGDHSKLIGSGPSPDAAVAAKQDLDNLCGAFGGLSETHHEILVLRELEGLSYQQIGQRMGMSRPAVESTLFRARRRLTEEYDDIVSGARCLRIQDIIVTAAQSRLGTRDTRRLARHLSHCQGCRREALAAGLDRELLTRPSVRERLASRVAGLLPFPAFVKFRGRAADAASQLPMFSDHVSTGWGKAAAGAAILAAGVGAGAGVHQVATPSAAADRPAEVRTASAADKPVAAKKASGTLASAKLPQAGGATGTSDEKGSRAHRKRDTPSRAKKDRRGEASNPSPPDAAPRTPSGGGEPAKSTPTDSNPASSSEAPKKDTSLLQGAVDEEAGRRWRRRRCRRPSRRSTRPSSRPPARSTTPSTRPPTPSIRRCRAPPTASTAWSTASPAAARSGTPWTVSPTSSTTPSRASARPSTTPSEASPEHSEASAVGGAARLLIASGRGAAW